MFIYGRGEGEIVPLGFLCAPLTVVNIDVLLIACSVHSHCGPNNSLPGLSWIITVLLCEYILTLGQFIMCSHIILFIHIFNMHLGYINHIIGSIWLGLKTEDS